MISRISMFFFILGFIICCSSNSKNETDRKIDKRLETFLNKMDSMKLPFEIIGNDLANYTEKAFKDTPDSTFLIQNPILKPIENNEFDFIHDKYLNDSTYKMFTISKKRINGFYLVVMAQFYNQRDEFWIKLNIFNLKGTLIDTMTFAGQKVGYYKLDGKMNLKNEISTFSYHEYQEDTTNLKNYYATELRKDYTISEDGLFKLNKSSKDRAYFTNFGENNVVSRADTIDGKYRY